MEAPSRGFSLIDLGAARRIGERPPAPLGRFDYMAPEMFERGPADPAADIFGLAAVAWRMLAGRPPEPFVPAPATDRPDFLDLLETCLSPDPARRSVFKKTWESWWVQRKELSWWASTLVVE